MLNLNKTLPVRVVLLFLVSSFSITAYSQIDITKYASKELFEVKPIISQEQIEEDQVEEEEYSSQFDFDLKKGIDFWSNGDYDDAAFQFEELLSENPEVTLLHYYLGWVNYERDRNEAAKDHFATTLRQSPLFLEAKYMLGILAVEDKEMSEARTYLKPLIEVPKYAAYGHHGLGLVALYEGSVQRAYRNFKKSTEADSSFLEAYIPMINIDLFYNDIRRARKVVEKGLRADKDWQQGIIIRGIISLLQDENTFQFERDIDRLLELDPSNYHYHSIKGFLEIELANYSSAIKLFRTAYNLEVDSARKGEFKFSSSLKRDEAIQRSLNYYDENYDMDQSARDFLEKGICDLISGDKIEALEAFDQALTFEDNAVINTFKGTTQKTMSGRNQLVIRDYTTAIEQDSTNWVALSYRAEAHRINEDPQAAYNDYSSVIKLKPRLKEGYKNRGIILLQSNNFNKAYKDFTFGIVLDSSDYDMYFNRSICAMQKGYFQNAEKDLQYIVSHKPEDGETYYSIFNCKIAQGDTLGALSPLDSASKYRKYNKKGHEELLKLATDLSNDASILNAHNRLVKYNSWNYEHIFNRAMYYYDKALYSKAEDDLRKFLKGRRKSARGFYYLGMTMQKLGDAEQAEKYLKRAKKQGYEPEKG